MHRAIHQNSAPLRRPAPRRRLLVYSFLLLSVGALHGPGLASAAPATDVWDSVLKAHVRNGRVDYRALKNDAKAREGLSRFVGSLEAMADDASLADWLNAYNALVVHAVIARYPIDSVMSVPDFFKAKRFRVAGRLRSLDEVEHKVIRPRFKDARVHVALNCGAISCPALHGRAFRDATVDATLTRLARAMVRDARHVQRRADGWHVSALFQWFAEDFVRDAGSVGAWIARYRGEEDAKGPTTLTYLPYDWRLNDRRGGN